MHNKETPSPTKNKKQDINRNHRLNQEFKDMLKSYQEQSLSSKEEVTNKRHEIIERSKGYILISMQKENTENTDIQTYLPNSDLEQKLLCFEALITCADLLKRQDKTFDPVKYLDNYYKTRNTKPESQN